MSFLKSPAGVITLLLFLIGAVMFFVLKPFRKSPTTSQASELDKMIVDTLMNHYGMDRKTAEMWAAVSRHETADYTSNLFKTANNLFGMKVPKTRTTNASSKPGSDYAHYKSPLDSVIDLALYLAEFDYPREFAYAANLVQFMQRKGYFTDTLQNYLNGVGAAGRRAGFSFQQGYVNGAGGSW